MIIVREFYGDFFCDFFGDFFGDFSGEFLPVAEFYTDVCSSDEWDFVPSMINALFDFPTPFQDAEEEVEKIMGGIQEDIMNSEEKQNLQELLRENLHHDIFQLNTKDDNGFFTWLNIWLLIHLLY